jgi:hypothetical protein
MITRRPDVRARTRGSATRLPGTPRPGCGPVRVDMTHPLSVNLAHVDIGEVSRIALALSGVRESSVRGQLRWSLAGRLVARQIDETSIVIRTGFVEREQLLVAHPTTFFVPPRFDAHMMVVARLAHADSTAVAAAIRAAWDLQTSAV